MSIDATNSIRFHLSLNVSDLEQSVRFFEAMLGIIPAKCRKDYAKFELDDPPLVLSLEPVPPNGRGALNHAGFRFPNSEALVASQRRLELAGFQTQREEGVECCYSRQTKFWVHDPDGGLWEFYVLEGDIQHRGAGQASADLLPQVGNCGPACGDQPSHAVNYEHRMGDKLTLASVDDASLAEVRLRGTFNLSEYGTRISEVLADVWRALQPGGKLQIHVLTADQPLNGAALTLPGPAAAVKYVPVDNELLQEIANAQMTNVTLTTFRATPCFHLGSAELRETMIVAHKPLPDLCGQTRVVMYKGPFQQVTDDEGRTFHRGERLTIPLSAWETLEHSPLANQFVCFAPQSAIAAACTAH